MHARSTDPIFITASEVAALIGFGSGSAFLTRRKDLERDHDFPMPVPTCRAPLKWRREMVQGWIEAQGRPASAAPAPLPDPTVPRTPKLRLIQQARSA